MSKLTSFFNQYLEKDQLFNNKTTLLSNYIPESVLYRDEQIELVAQVLAPALKQEKPSNLFIYGPTGTGKTLSIKHVTQQMLSIAQQKHIPLHISYLNCKLKRVADTEYRLIAQLSRDFDKIIPATGLPTDEVYKIFFEALDKKEGVIIIILDEIDQLVKKAGDEILYNLTRINSELKKSQVAIIGISNDLVFTEGLDARVKSSLSEEELVFPKYNALQIQNILRDRAKIAFKPEAVAEGVIEKCSAYAAREHGDVRRAIDLLRVAGEIAERKGLERVEIEHLDEAEEKIERDRMQEVVMSQPKQHQVCLYAIILVCDKQENKHTYVLKGEVYEHYRELCNHVGIRPLTQRRISDIITELDMLGIINAKVISKGRFGRTREIMLSIPQSNKPKIVKILQESCGL
ncbi:MAG: ORC1-type DNA replication protein [Candidatus Woesearchaeota archaeon]